MKGAGSTRFGIGEAIGPRKKPNVRALVMDGEAAPMDMILLPHQLFLLR